MFDLDRWEEIWQTINRNRKRSIMTAFGVFWGIFMLTIMMGAGLGLKRLMYSSFGSMAVNSCFYWGGADLAPLTKDSPRAADGPWRMRTWQQSRPQVPGVKNVAGIIWGSTYKFSRKDKKGDYQLMGYTPEFQEISPQTLRFGRYINDIDMAQQRKVCVITEQVWEELFPNRENPVGQTIRMNNMYLTVVGVCIPPRKRRAISGSDLRIDPLLDPTKDV